MPFKSAVFLCFSTLEKWPSVGDVLCIPAMYSPLVTQWLGTSWSQDNVWPAFVDSVCSLQDFSFLASGACPLVVEAGLETCAGVGLGPLVGRAMSRGVSRGVCGLRKSLGACLLMGGAVSPLSLLFGLRHSSTRAYRLLGGARSWC